MNEWFFHTMRLRCSSFGLFHHWEPTIFDVSLLIPFENIYTVKLSERNFLEK